MSINNVMLYSVELKLGIRIIVYQSDILSTLSFLCFQCLPAYLSFRMMFVTTHPKNYVYAYSGFKVECRVQYTHLFQDFLKLPITLLYKRLCDETHCTYNLNKYLACTVVINL